MHTLNLATFIPCLHDATSFYRGAGPLGALRKTIQKPLNISLIQNVNWSSLKLVDAVFLQRPFTNDHLTIVKLAKSQGLPVWVDYDDDLFSLPRSNPCYSLYMNEQTHQNIANILALADHVSVSTKVLKDKIERLNKNITVIPNAFDDYLFYAGERKPQNKLIAWRGSDTHKEDLNAISEACINLSKKYPDWLWNFVGAIPWFADYMQNKVICTPALDIMEYNAYMQKVKPAIMIVPLAHNDFNKAKSNCAWLESSFFGAHTIAPAWHPDFNLPGITNYSKDFEHVLEKAMWKDFDSHARQNEKSWLYIQENLLLSQTNLQREEIINLMR